MIGSILGDIAGSVYEFRNIKTKEFPFLTPQKGYTDDSILTLEIGRASCRERV